MKDMQKIDRLLTYFIPENYNLSLTLDRENRHFDGVVDIKGAVTTHDKVARFHAKDLTIERVIVDGKVADYSLSNDELRVSHDDLTQGSHLITISFSGTITDPMHGLYPCYFTHDGTAYELLATQFESHHAREVFPCIDEPAAKATFDLTLTTETGVTALSNMPVRDQREENDALVTNFATSPRMSTYLLAWVVGNLHRVNAKTNSGVDVSIWATPAQSAESMTFALDIATRTIDFFDEYFDTPYPLPKSDHIALPDFSSGAMENWGLITYREVALLADPKTASLENKRQAATVIAHELSHQWFGNLVTMEWWNDLWLNESFANMMEYVAIDAIEPTWHVWLDFSSYEVIQALHRDSLDGVQAIQADVNHPDEISTLFDPSIVYAKGSRLLRMLQTFIGDEAMQTGLKQYFKTYAYQNTQADDLWRCLSEASGQDVGALMNSWIQQSGYPVVTVSRQADTLTITQEQFFIGDHRPSEKRWRIPLAAENQWIPALMTQPTLEIPAQSDTPIINHDSTAHFLTDYSTELRAEVFAAIPHMSDIDRLKILNEQTLLAQAGRLKPASLIELLDHYRQETNEAVWGVMSMVINDLKKYVETDEVAEDKLRALAARLASDQYDRLGWDPRDNEPEDDTKLRSLIISLALYGRMPDALKEATARFSGKAASELDPNLRVAIMAHAVRDDESGDTVASLLAQHHDSTSSELREDIAAAVTATRDPSVARETLSLIKDPKMVRPQDVTRWAVWLLRNKHSRQLTWQWLRDNWQWIEDTFGSDKSYDIYPRYIASTLMTSEQLAEYIEFFTPLRDQPALVRNIDIGITELRARVALIQAEGPAVREALLKLS